MRPGELVLEHATRTFSVRADHGRTLKELVLRRRAEGPPPVHALRDVSLHVEPGETLGIVGATARARRRRWRVLAGIVRSTPARGLRRAGRRAARAGRGLRARLLGRRKHPAQTARCTG